MLRDRHSDNQKWNQPSNRYYYWRTPWRIYHPAFRTRLLMLCCNSRRTLIWCAWSFRACKIRWSNTQPVSLIWTSKWTGCPMRITSLPVISNSSGLSTPRYLGPFEKWNGRTRTWSGRTLHWRTSSTRERMTEDRSCLTGRGLGPRLLSLGTPTVE